MSYLETFMVMAIIIIVIAIVLCGIPMVTQEQTRKSAFFAGEHAQPPGWGGSSSSPDGQKLTSLVSAPFGGAGAGGGRLAEGTVSSEKAAARRR